MHRHRAGRSAAARFRLALAFGVGALSALVGLPAAMPEPAFAAQPTSTPPAPVRDCVVQDRRLAELSGLAADREFRYAVGDGGSRLQVFVLRKDCSVQRVITAAVDPFDVEDLAIGPDGRIWLADIGDNDQRRETIALHVLSPDGAPQLYRLTYPDRPHDAEALLLDRDGQPYVITKDAFGGSGVYRPAGPLQAPGPTPLELVTSVRFSRSATTGGPVGSIGSMIITGGATSADGQVVALRTYTDAYLFDASKGDLVQALQSQPVRVPLPDEPQGEAIAFEPDGTLLSGSERADAGPQPLRAVPDATALLRTAVQPPPTTAAPSSSAPSAEATAPTRSSLSDWQAVLIAVIGAAAVVVVISRLARRN